MTGGLLLTTETTPGDVGIRAGVGGNGGGGSVLVNMTGGPIGAGAQRVGTGIFSDLGAANTAGGIDITARDISAVNNGIDARASFAANAGDINVTANGTINSAVGNAINIVNVGSGSTTVTVNSAIVGVMGIAGGAGPTSVFNFGSVAGTGGTAVDLGAGIDIYDGRGGTVVGTVRGGNGDDSLFSGAGNETFDDDADVDRVDYAGASGPVTVSLAAGTATGHGNDTLIEIENALGGAFDDVLIGGAGANILTGRGGADTFVVAPGGGPDSLEDFVAGLANPDDRIDTGAFAAISSLADILALATQVGPNTVINFGGGDTLTLRDVAVADLVDSDFFFVAPLGDVLWRHDDGQVRTAQQDLAAVPNTFEIAGTGDFDADGDADIVGRHVDGLVVTWEMQGGTLLATHSLADVPNNFQIAGTGDFDGDGDSDILWRGSQGQVVTWEMEDGLLVTNHNHPTVSTSFQIAGTGDFDGDGDADILWRHIDGTTVTWEMEDGDLLQTHNFGVVSTSFAIAGTGDFDRDGDADILWRHVDGTTVTWEMQGGDLLGTHNFGIVSTNFQVEGTEDFDSDGDADILWRHTEGIVVTWQMEDGALQATENFGVTPNTWQIVGTGEFDLA